MPAPPVPASLQSSVNATKVEYVQLGSSGLRVSVPILGTMGIGSKDWQDWVMEEEEGLEILKAAWDRGLSTWDTANVYSSGINEEIIGKAIKKFEIPRHKLTILAKCCGTVPEEPGIFNWPFEAQMKKSKDYVNQGGLSRGAVFKAVDASLKRLGTDYMDLLQIHRYDASVPPEETMKALHDLVQAGKVHYIGASSMWTYQFARMQFIAEKNGWTKFVSMQNRYNLCYREKEREMNKFCNETGVGLIPWGPLFSGLLVPHGLPEIVDGHMKYALVDWCYSQPQSILGLAIFAVSHATFGRARRSHAALAVGSTKYSKALVKTNLALKDASEATHDEVLLAIMLLSFYENSVMEKTSHVSSRGIQAMASRSFTHHDGAMAVLNLRRQLDQRTNYSMGLDKLVRRQLMRSLLLRSMSLPSWLQDGSQYGEHGFALELDRCMVGAAKLRHQASSLSVDFASLSISDRYDEMVRLGRLLAEAQTLDNVLVIWANDLPTENWYSTRTVQDDEIGNRILDGTVHIYHTVGHAGMWNRYRALRLTVNDTMLKTLSVLAESSDSDTESLEEAVKLRIQRLADDLCASVPYMLGLIEPHDVAGHDVTVVTKTPASPKQAVKATTAAFLCWPLTMATMVSGIPERHQRYLRNRLLDVSEIVDDGVLERIAADFSSISH